MKILHVVGARPNFMKIAPVMREMSQHHPIQQMLVHTGQHYDEEMSDIFFRELGLPQPDVNLGVGSGSHAQQTARIMSAFEPVLLEYQPDLLVVVGDVNSTLACSLTASKLLTPIAHIEAGLRSFDRSMPEEINRLVTDALSDLLFTTSPEAESNLRREGIAPEKIFFVGNTMIDTLLQLKEYAAQLPLLDGFGLEPHGFALVTLHRPSNVDKVQIFQGIMEALVEIQCMLPVLFPVHPRTRQRIMDSGLGKDLSTQAPHLHLVDPLGYLAFLKLMMEAKMVLTDSGGVQEETTVLGVPCITIRENTERPITVTQGTNVLVGTDPRRILQAALDIVHQEKKAPSIPPLWDGKAAQRIVQIIVHR
jgi:UDP-N-acetylglucosamine 2-epimerase (non-hydrolysing)